jgi:DUF4097 and DUF4098 domain-containing protein YvlB
MRRQPFATGLTALGVIIPALCAAPAPAAAQQTQQRFSLEGQRVEIYDVVGRATLHRGGGGAVVVQATRVGADAARLEFATDREGAGGTARFRVVYPLDQLDDGIFWAEEDGTSDLRLRADGTFGGDGENWFGRGSGSVRVGSRGGFRGSADLDITVPEGREVVLHLAVGSVALNGTNGTFTIDTWGASVRAQDITGSYLFDSGSGDVEVRGGTGTIRIDTGSGTGTVSGIRGDLLEIDTGSGDADATDVQVERVRFDTGSGQVRARGIQARRGAADTGSGDVELEFTGGEIEDWLIDTGSGEARLTLPGNASARISVDTGSGDIDVTRANVVMERREHDAMVLRVGDGRGRIRIDTGSGDVTIR